MDRFLSLWQEVWQVQSLTGCMTGNSSSLTGFDWFWQILDLSKSPKVPQNQQEIMKKSQISQKSAGMGRENLKIFQNTTGEARKTRIFLANLEQNGQIRKIFRLWVHGWTIPWHILTSDFEWDVVAHSHTIVWSTWAGFRPVLWAKLTMRCDFCLLDSRYDRFKRDRFYDRLFGKIWQILTDFLGKFYRFLF